MVTKIKSIRLERKLTQEQVSQLIGMTRTGYANIERGYRTPSFKLARKIKQVFNYKNDDLFDIVS